MQENYITQIKNIFKPSEEEVDNTLNLSNFLSKNDSFIVSQIIANNMLNLIYNMKTFYETPSNFLFFL